MWLVALKGHRSHCFKVRNWRGLRLSDEFQAQSSGVWAAPLQCSLVPRHLLAGIPSPPYFRVLFGEPNTCILLFFCCSLNWIGRKKKSDWQDFPILRLTAELWVSVKEEVNLGRDHGSRAKFERKSELARDVKATETLVFAETERWQLCGGSRKGQKPLEAEETTGKAPETFSPQRGFLKSL